jgi:hypothetical protein
VTTAMLKALHASEDIVTPREKAGRVINNANVFASGNARSDVDARRRATSQESDFLAR